MILTALHRYTWINKIEFVGIQEDADSTLNWCITIKILPVFSTDYFLGYDLRASHV